MLLPSSRLLLIVGQLLSCFSNLRTGQSLKECEHVLTSEKCPFRICVQNIYFYTAAFAVLSFSTRRLVGEGAAGAGRCCCLLSFADRGEKLLSCREHLK